MSLLDWLYRNRMSKAELAREMGISRATVANIITGAHCPTLAVAVKIEALTQGDVTPRCLYQGYLQTKEIPHE